MKSKMTIDTLSQEFINKCTELENELSKWLIEKIEKALLENDTQFALAWECVLFQGLIKCIRTIPKSERIQAAHFYSTKMMDTAIFGDELFASLEKYANGEQDVIDEIINIFSKKKPEDPELN